MFDALASLLVYDLAGLTPDSPLGAALHFFVMDVAKILVLLTTVIYLMGLRLQDLDSSTPVRNDEEDWSA
jgi:hypothetical protein